MENEQKKVEQASVLELKAAAYDALAQIEAQQHVLRLINQELAKRNTPQEEIK